MRTLAILVLLLGSTERAQALNHTTADVACIGACSTAGQVTITDLVILVKIVLGDVPPSVCSAGIANGSAVDVSLVIQAVNNALDGCLLPTFTPTPTATPTASPTPGYPDVAGVWREDQLKLISSNCNSATANVLSQAVSQVPAICDTTFTQDGSHIHGVDCQGNSDDGTVDAAGNLQFVETDSETASGCLISVTTSWGFNGSQSPTTSMYTTQIGLSGSCGPLAACTGHLQSRLTRQ